MLKKTYTTDKNGKTRVACEIVPVLSVDVGDGPIVKVDWKTTVHPDATVTPIIVDEGDGDT